MLYRTLITYIPLFVAFVLLLIVDSVIGVHVFSIGFLLSLVFFMTSDRIFSLFLIFGFFNDVSFQLPLGMTFLLIAPYFFFFPTLIAIVKSRMILLYGYLVLCGSVMSVLQFQHALQPTHIILTLCCGAVWTVCVYLYAIRRYQDFSFNTKKKSIQF